MNPANTESTEYKEDLHMNIPENILSALTDEQKKKVEAARSPEELLVIAEEYGQELTPEQLEAVAGGLSPHHPAPKSW